MKINMLSVTYQANPDIPLHVMRYSSKINLYLRIHLKAYLMKNNNMLMHNSRLATNTGWQISVCALLRPSMLF